MLTATLHKLHALVFFKAMCYPVLRRIIIMIDTHVYRFDKSIIFYVVATQQIINDLCIYADMHHKSDSFHIVDFMKRILFHDAYCCVTSNSFFYGTFAHFFRRELKKKKHLISFDQYLEAFCIAYPEEACKILPFDKDDLIPVIRDNPWFSIYKVDEEDIIRRLLNTCP